MTPSPRQKLQTITEKLLSPDTPLEREVLIPPLRELHTLLAEITGVRGAVRDGASPREYLPTGLILPFQNAADCIMDPLRTTKYLRAMDAAIRTARERFPGETIHALYAGTGPYAPFAFPLFTRYDEQTLKFTLLEISTESIQSIQRLAAAFEVQNHIVQIVQTDATAYQHEGEPFQIAVAECMQKALSHEGQVAITLNIGRQLHPDGFFIPERVSINACLGVLSKEFKDPLSEATLAERIPLGEVFNLGPDLYRSWQADASFEKAVLKCARIDLPDSFPTGRDMMLRTTIELFDDLILTDFETGLTHPHPLLNLDELQQLKAVECEYRIFDQPGFFLEKIYKSGVSPFPVIVAASGIPG